LPISQCVDRVGEALALRMAAYMLDYRVTEDPVIMTANYLPRQIAGVGLVDADPSGNFSGFGFELDDMKDSRTDRRASPRLGQIPFEQRTVHLAEGVDRGRGEELGEPFNRADRPAAGLQAEPVPAAPPGPR
jgi:hypothetical protein